jgi:3'(2'), 5'-bisphosphate nucleotidase
MWEREIREAVSLVRDSGRILMEVYATDFEVELKNDEDPVTVADRRANAFLVQSLRERFPGDGVVAEETEDQSDALRGGRCWYVDPLDGTKEFISRNGEFSVMIGLAVDGEARLGVVYQPVLDKLYRGVVGEGAHLDTGGRTDPLTVSEVTNPEELRLIVSRSHRDESIDELMRRLGITREQRSGSVGLKIGHITERTADLYVHVSDRSKAWDACGPEAILRAAGGVFTDMAGEPFRYGGTELRNLGGILACNRAAYEAVLPAVRQIGLESGLLR